MLPRAAGIWSLDLLAGHSWCPRGCEPAWGPIPAACSTGSHVGTVGFREQGWGVDSYRKYRQMQVQEGRQDMLMLFPLKGKKSSIL